MRSTGVVFVICNEWVSSVEGMDASMRSVAYAAVSPYTFSILPYKESLDDFSSNDSLYGRMENVYGLTAAYATERIEASMPSTEETHSLQITKTTPVLRIQRRTFLKNGTPMESVESVYRCDTYCVILNLRRP